MTVSDRDRITIRNSLFGLTLLQIAVAAWMLLDRRSNAERFAEGLNTALFFLAGLCALFASYLGFKRKLAPLRAAVGTPFVWGLLLVSLMSLALVDYGGLGAAGPLVPVVLVVSITVAYLRARSR